MNKKCLALSLASSFLASSLLGWSPASAMTETTAISRGEFLKVVSDHLKLVPKDKSRALPMDVTEDSPYADAIRSLRERKVIFGYDDGTMKAAKPISKEEAHAVVSRILGLDPAQAGQIMSHEFSVSFGEDSLITPEEASQVITKVLSSDPQALQWVMESSEIMEKQDSFRSNLSQHMRMELSQQTPENNVMPDMTLSSDVKMEFNKDTGIRMIIHSKLPQALPDGKTEMQMEQYIVPDGMFMTMENPETKKTEWFKMSSALPFTFDQLMEMQKNSVKVNKHINNKYMFYHYVDTEELEGKTLHKVSFFSRFASFEEMMEIMSQEMPKEFTQTLQSTPGTGSLSLSGTMWFDEESKLPVKFLQHMTIDYDQPVSENPIKKMEMEQEGTYSDFNQVGEIKLPEEARQAQELPMPEQTSKES